MHYEEQISNGELYCRSEPNGRWRLVQYSTVLERLVEARKTIKEQQATIHEQGIELVRLQTNLQNLGVVDNMT